MKRDFVKIVALVCTVLVMLGACQKEEPSGSVEGDYLMLKTALGKPMKLAEVLAQEKGYQLAAEKGDIRSLEKRYQKTDSGVTKELRVYAYRADTESAATVSQTMLLVKNDDILLLKRVFKQWLREFQQGTDFRLIMREDYRSSVNNVKKNYTDLQALLAEVDQLPDENELSITVDCVDKYAIKYSITLYYWDWYKGIELNLFTYRVLGEAPDDPPFYDHVVGKTDDILVMKVDYLTFRNNGYTTVNVRDRTGSGDTIPFYAAYRYPGDFGFIKLYYKQKDSANLLFSGSIVWMGCGEMDFPTNWVTGRENYLLMAYPGQERFSFIDESGTHQKVTDETELRKVWESVSMTEAFQWFYNHSSKRAAVYLYRPSVGIGNPADWYYLVFVENGI